MTRVLIAIPLFLIALGGTALVLAQRPISVGAGLPAVKIDPAAARVFDTKIAQVGERIERSAATGEPAVIEVVLTDQELTSKANEVLASGTLALPVPVSNVQVRATNGALTATASASVQGVTVNLGVVARPQQSGGRTQIVVERVETSLPLPGAVADEIRRQLGRALDPSTYGVPLDITRIEARGGSLRIVGSAR